VLLYEPGSFLLHTAAVYQAEGAGGLPSHEDVLGHGKMRSQQALLVDHAYAVRLRFGWRAERHALAAPKDLTSIRGDHPGDDLHQRRFTGAVFSHQEMDFTGIDA
jgi:hypothetical protein